MSISYNSSKNLFQIDTVNTSYAFSLNAETRLVHLYWGKKINHEDSYDDLMGNLSIKANGDHSFHVIANQQSEYKANEPYCYDESALDVSYSDGNHGCWLVYKSHKISDDGNELCVTLRDEYYPVEVDLYYKIYDKLDLITRYAVIRNNSNLTIKLNKFQSATLHFPRAIQYRLTHYAGNWGCEYQKNQIMLDQSVIQIRNNHGNTSGPHAVPFFALDEKGIATETTGEVFFGSLHWSGNFKMTFEKTSLQYVYASIGINDENTTITLEQGESFTAPKVTCGYTEKGFGNMSEQLYDFQYDHLLPQNKAHEERPILYNGYGTYEMNIDEEKMRGLIEKSADIGIELFVIDDGWMPGRVDDRKGLGDWVACPERFPNGLRPLSDLAHSKGMLFGLWVEPEMANPDSDLFRAHPEWILKSPHRDYTTSRNQVVLNLSLEEVYQFAEKMLDGIIEDYKLDYLKWDMNRYISDFGWDTDDQRAKDEVRVKYIKNVYRLWAHMNKKYPHVIYENCAHGGARADYGMAEYTDRINRSDNHGSLDVMLMHEGFGTFFLPKLSGGACNFDSYKGLPYNFRENLAMAGSMSFGMNLLSATSEDIADYKKSIADFKILRKDLQDSYMYRILSLYNTPYVVWQYVRRDRKVFTLFGFCVERHYYDNKMPRVKMTGLIPGAKYKCDDGKTYSAEMLTNIGLQLPLNKKYDSVRMKFEIVE